VNSGQFIARIHKNSLPAAVLLLGPEAYERRRIKEALIAHSANSSVVEAHRAVVREPTGLEAIVGEVLELVKNQHEY
jgi:hypothetical protein